MAKDSSLDEAGVLRTILLVDDESNLRKLVHTTLEDPRYRILEATSGSEALQLVHTECPDVLILDWMMPGMTGIQLVKILGEEKSLSKMSVIMLTAKGQERDREQASALGIRHYLVKPFSPRELLEKVESILEI